MTHLKTIIMITLLGLRIFCCSPPACAENQLISENQANAAFVCNVARYVTWPQTSSKTLVIGVLGKGSLDRAWLDLRGKTVHGRILDVRKSDDLDDLINCQIIFIGSPKHRNISRILLALQVLPILTISDTSGFAQSGGMVHLFMENDKIRFKVNLSAVKQSGLKISAQLLKLAKEVIE